MKDRLFPHGIIFSWKNHSNPPFQAVGMNDLSDLVCGRGMEQTLHGSLHSYTYLLVKKDA